MLNNLSVSRFEDIPIITKIHLASFQGFFLTFLGERFLSELYDAIREDPTGIELVFCAADRTIIGFVAGTDQPSGLYQRLLRRRWWRFGWAALPAFLRKPSILPRLLRAFTMPGQPLPAANCGTLMSIGVDPVAQGSGVGKALVQAFLREGKNRGLDFVNLTTDAHENEATNAFYLARGFKLHRSFTTPEGRLMNEFLYNLHNLDNSD